MSVHVIRITEVECDDCGYVVNFTDTKAYAVRTLREEGWSVGSRVLCPECRMGTTREGRQ